MCVCVCVCVCVCGRPSGLEFLSEHFQFVTAQVFLYLYKLAVPIVKDWKNAKPFFFIQSYSRWNSFSVFAPPMS